MPAKEVICRVTEKLLLTPTVLGLRFEPSRKFRFEPGQFLSVIVPNSPKYNVLPTERRRVRRIYSFSSPWELGYELCIKHTGGPGPTFLESLAVGDEFRATAPYGDFLFEPRKGRNACFISTGTGVAPFRSILMSDHFRDHRPERVFSFFGARTEDEIIYPGLFEALDVETTNCISQPGQGWKGYKGRVTEYLSQLPPDWPWHSTDFYLCGNGEMVNEAVKTLRNARGVAEAAIIKEVYFGGHAPSAPSTPQVVAAKTAEFDFLKLKKDRRSAA